MTKIIELILNHTTAQIALLGAFAGGTFALINQIVGKLFDWHFSKKIKSKQAKGFFLAVVSEQLRIIPTLMELLILIDIQLEQEESEFWADVAKSRISQWLRYIKTDESALRRYFASDIVAECDADSAIELNLVKSLSFDAITAARDACEDTLSLSKFNLEFIRYQVEQQCRMWIEIAFIIALNNRVFRNTSIWLSILSTLKAVSQHNIKIYVRSWEDDSIRKLKKYLPLALRRIGKKSPKLAKSLEFAVSAIDYENEPPESEVFSKFTNEYGLMNQPSRINWNLKKNKAARPALSSLNTALYYRDQSICTSILSGLKIACPPALYGILTDQMQ